jgi:hypothetical protein
MKRIHCLIEGKSYVAKSSPRNFRSFGAMEATTPTVRSVITPPNTTDYTPALTQQENDLILAWRDSASPHNLNAMRFPMSNLTTIKAFGERVVLSPDTSNGAVALATNFGQPYIAWGGTDSANQLNIRALPPWY